MKSRPTNDAYYEIAFVRLFDRFPQQQLFELFEGLACFSTKNRFYRANRDLGRIFKTEFILQYLSEPELRCRIRRRLLKGGSEQISRLGELND